jgi:hypothetical protein
LIGHNGLEDADIELCPEVNTQPMKRKPFLRIPSIGRLPPVIEYIGIHLRPQIGQVKLPNPGVQLEKHIGVGEIGKDHRAVSFSDEISVLAQLGFDVRADLKGKISRGRKITEALISISFPKALPGNSPIGEGILSYPRRKIGLGRKEGGVEADLLVYTASQLNPSGISELECVLSRHFPAAEVNNGINMKVEDAVLVMEKV